MSRARQRQALIEAAEWDARLAAAPGCPQTHAGWHAWHNAADDHRWAWQRLEQLQAELRGLPRHLANGTLAQAPAALGRRALVRSLVLGGSLAAAGWAGYRANPQWSADLRTAVGERRHWTLADGSQLTLNTASAVDLLFTAQQRLIILRAGELLLTTGKDPRPLRVQSADGLMRALGTRFSVRQFSEHTRLTVLEHAVAVSQPGIDSEQVIHAGMALDFGPGRWPAAQPGEANDTTWAQGQLVFDNWPLSRVLDELARYRPGFIRCAPEVATLRVSGAYPLDDTDQALAALTQALPVRVERLTRYWVRVSARA